MSSPSEPSAEHDPVPDPAAQDEVTEFFEHGRMLAPAMDDADRLHCMIEIPKGSRNKYEWDEKLGAIKLDRFLFSSVVYPSNPITSMRSSRGGGIVSIMLAVARKTTSERSTSTSR